MNFDNDFIIQDLSRRLEKARFTGGEKSRALNFRCPLCGDSEKSENKRRGYIYQKDGGVWFCCHNCGVNLSFRNFLKETFPDLFQQYTLEKIKEKETMRGHVEREDVSLSIDGLTPLKTLPKDHPAVLYVENRKIPHQKWQFIYYGDKLDELLLCPFPNGIVFTTSNKLFVARNIEAKSKYRYYIKKTDENVLFGEQYISKESDVKITEGLIDSLFLNNCVPALNSNLLSVARQFNSPILVWDNEPRNFEICSKMWRAIKEGFRVVIYPPELADYKDINELVLAGFDVEKIINKNNFKGIIAFLKFNLWKRV